MNDWLKKVTEKIKSFWKDSSVAKKAIFIGVIALVIVIFVVTATVSSSDTMVSVFTESLTDENDIIRITNFLDSKNVDYRFDKQNGKILVKDKKTASYWKSNLSAEGLVPSYIDPYKELKREWSTTDADQNIKIKQAVQKQLKNYLENIIYSNNIDKYELLLLLGKAHDIIYYSNMFKRETAMDNFRKDNCNKLPSRLHSIYLTDEKSLDNWIDKLTRNGEDFDLFRVEALGNIFKTSEELIPIEVNSYEQVYNDSYNYWHPNFKKVDDKSNEYLVQGKVKVLEKINHTKK